MIKLHAQRRCGPIMRELISQWFKRKSVFVAKQRTFELTDEQVAHDQDPKRESHHCPDYRCYVVNQHDEMIFSFVPHVVQRKNLDSTGRWSNIAPAIVIMSEKVRYLLEFPEFKLRPLPGEKFTLQIKPYYGPTVEIELIEKDA